MTAVSSRSAAGTPPAGDPLPRGQRIAVLALRGLALLPLSWSRLLGSAFGELMYRSNAKRRRIARINLELCFPHLAPAERKVLLRRHFRLLGQSYFDLAFLAWSSNRRFERKIELVGREHLRASLARGRPVILLAPHALGMNVGGIAVSSHAPVFSMVKPQRSPVLNRVLEKARTRYGAPLIARAQGLRPVLRGLQQGLAFYYLPDEDFGPAHSVFAPFFGVPTATITMLGRLAGRAGADVIPCFTRLLAGGRGYRVELNPPLAGFPTGDPVADAARMNEALEAGIRAAPEQYMWTFRLFRTRPGGAPSPYG